jgi:hypothetical protein
MRAMALAFAVLVVMPRMLMSQSAEAEASAVLKGVASESSGRLSFARMVLPRRTELALPQDSASSAASQTHLPLIVGTAAGAGLGAWLGRMWALAHRPRAYIAPGGFGEQPLTPDRSGEYLRNGVIAGSLIGYLAGWVVERRM